MPGVNPYISFPGTCREAIAFYQNALDAELLFLHTVGDSPMADMGPPDNIMHATIKVGSTVIMMSDDCRPDAAPAGGNISLAVGLSDVELSKTIFGRLSEGGTVIMPMEKTYWAEAFGMLVDKFGIKWMVNCEAPR